MNTRQPPMILAPGASSGGAYAPGKGQSLPAVDDRLVAPEAHAQVIDGRLIRTMGSNPPHATRHFEAAHVFAGALAEGFEGAVDMRTRADDDAAPDISGVPRGSTCDGRLGCSRSLSRFDTERLGHATEKVKKLAARGKCGGCSA
ncbi:MAG: hypothetical protein R3A52_32855 [Polyangiales bacterium]